MKLSVSSAALLLLGVQASSGFTLPTRTTVERSLQQHPLRSPAIATTQLFMFGGAGAGSPAEDDEAGEEAMKKTAAAMGMSVGEYKLAMQARQKLVSAMDDKIVTGGKADTVLVERDVNNPPKKFEIKITESGKALGKETVAKDLVAALKTASEAARKGRVEAQQEMMKWVQSQSPN
ncbi:hypothetical protein IV203_026174 [Nitzschia inconspicua]|uniref:Uncharacterized protein n=1 Tax=Nitzschia inconspicua TaxID=303405 RepID=A0A9K3LJ83_9STRA|nr:hypothetical protein IV203_026174 [Nitzschia inconspicua]